MAVAEAADIVFRRCWQAPSSVMTLLLTPLPWPLLSPICYFLVAKSRSLLRGCDAAADDVVAAAAAAAAAAVALWSGGGGGGGGGRGDDDKGGYYSLLAGAGEAMAGRHTRSVCVLVRGDRKVHPRRRRRLGFECTACGLLPGLRREELHRCVAHADTHPYGLRSETTVDYQVYEFQGRPTGRAEMCANVRCAWIPGSLVSREAVSPSKSPMSKRPRTSPGQNGPHGESEKKPKSPVKTSPNVPVSKRPQTSPGQNSPHGERARKNLSPPSKRPQTSPCQNVLKRPRDKTSPNVPVTKRPRTSP